MNTEDIDIRSEDIEDILGKAPSHIVRKGITVMFVVIVVAITMCWFFNYPDKIGSEITVTTENVPANIVARTSGKIVRLFVKDRQYVKKGSPLALIENTADYGDVMQVVALSDSIKGFINSDVISPMAFPDNYLLGDLQTWYSAFRKSYEDYANFLQLDYHRKKIASLNRQLEKYSNMSGKLEEQGQTREQEYELAAAQFRRDSVLYAGSTIPLADLDRSKSALLQSRYAYVTSKTVIDNNQIETEQLAQSILELQQDCLEKRKEYALALKQAFGNLQNQLKLWQQNYLLASPVDGNVTFTTYWSINQNVASGDKVMTIVPEKPSVLVGKITLPVKGSGKVKQGQKVNIRLDNYPYMEFGMVKGIVRNISLVPANNNYAVEVEFPEGLHTTYGKTLAFAQEMQGSAEIITENKRLLTRLFNPLRALMSE